MPQPQGLLTPNGVNTNVSTVPNAATGGISTTSPSPAAAPSPVYRYTQPTPPAAPGADPNAPGAGTGAAANSGTGGTAPFVGAAGAYAVPASGYSNPIDEFYKTLPKTAPTPEDEAAIQENYRAQAQSQIDAVNSYYNSMSTVDARSAANVSGQTRAADARSGTAGSPMAAADAASADAYNRQVADQTQATRQSALATITKSINDSANAEILARKQAALGNAQAYVQHLNDTQTQARQNLKDLAQTGMQLPPDQMAALQQQTGWDPMVFDAVYNANKAQGTAVKYSYTSLGNGTVLRTGQMANGQAVPEQKFQYDLGPNDEFQVAADGTPLIITKNGNQITSVKVAPGFDTGSLAPSRSAPVVTYPGATAIAWNPQTKRYETISVGQDGSPTTTPAAPQGGFRTDRMMNPTAMTTDVAKASGLVEGKDYTQGDPFTTSGGQTLYTAKFLGDPVATTIRALDQGGFYTAAGQPRWTYLGKLSQQAQQTIKNWQSATNDQKVAVVKEMYQQEGGSGAAIGQQAAATPSLTKDTLANDQQRQFYSQLDKGVPVDELKGTIAKGKVGYGAANDLQQATLAYQNDHPSYKITDPQIAYQAQVEGAKSVISQVQPREIAIDKATNALGVLQTLSDKFARSGVTTLNAAWLNSQLAVNNPDAIAFNEAAKLIADDIGNVFSSGGAVTDAKLAFGDNILDKNYSPQGIQTAIGTLKQLFATQRQAYEDAKSTYIPSATGGGSGTGLTITTPDGKTYTFSDQASLDSFKQAAGIQ